MLECVSIVAGMIVVSGPSKLEFGDVLAMTARTFVFVIYLLHCVTVTVLLCVCVGLCRFFERGRERLVLLYVSLLILCTFNTCFFYKLLK